MRTILCLLCICHQNVYKFISWNQMKWLGPTGKYLMYIFMEYIKWKVKMTSTLPLKRTCRIEHSTEHVKMIFLFFIFFVWRNSYPLCVILFVCLLLCCWKFKNFCMHGNSMMWNSRYETGCIIQVLEHKCIMYSVDFISGSEVIFTVILSDFYVSALKGTKDFCMLNCRMDRSHAWQRHYNKNINWFSF